MNRRVARLVGGLVLVVLGLVPRSVYSQGHPYPRTVCWIWSGAVPEWYAKFDVVVLNIFQPDQVVLDIKSLNPNAIVLPTVDWNVGAHLGSGIPSDFRVKLSTGSYYGWYVGANPSSSQYAPNYSTACPLVNGKQAWQWFAEYIVGKVNLSVWDGLATDGLYGGDYIAWNLPANLDLDCNGVADESEHGKTWIVSAWKTGVANLEKKVRELIGSDKYIMVNSGVGFRDHPSMSSLNGAMDEYYTYSVDWNSKWNEYNSFIAYCKKPQVSLVQSNPTYYDPLRTSMDTMKNYYSLMRYGLTQTMMGDGYYQYEDVFDAIHYWNRYYDEFDLNVGYPKGDRQKLGSRSIWVRFFDHGVAIVNVTGSQATVTDAELSTLSGYSGPYYRFKGGQDPTTNNGQLFDQVTLKGSTFSSMYTVGDGIVLVDEPTVCVSEVIVDDSDVGTSPASSAATLSGDWSKQYTENDNFRIRTASWITVKDMSAYAVADGGTASTAVFTPTIGVAGVYEVYEWHGYHDGYEGTAVNYTINHANGSRQFLINQRENQGQWNYLGESYFNAGKTGNVTISAQSSSGSASVIADAVKFVYVPDGEADLVPPLAPTNMRTSTVTENRISLVWDAPAQASDGDGAVYYRIYRNATWLGSINTTAYTDTGLTETTAYSYAVYSEDDAGNPSTSALQFSVSTLTDQTKPQILSVVAQDIAQILVTFTEAVNEASAETRSNYSIESGVTVLSATLQSDQRSVLLGTSEHVVGVSYTLVVSNVRDQAAAANVILSNSSMSYEAKGGSIQIAVACDDSYQLYVNGELVGSGNDWMEAQTYEVPSVAGKNVIAVKATDLEGLAGMVAEIDFNGVHYVTNDSWKVSSVLSTGWEGVDFDDLQWAKATSYGVCGTASPWADYSQVANISKDNNVQWIWTVDNDGDDVVYFRFTLRAGGDVTPPAVPTGLKRK